MDKLSTSIWEGDDYYSIPEEIFNQLPAKVRAPLDEIMKNGTEALEDVKHELDSFISLIKLIPTTSSLSYIYHRLRTTQFEATTEAMMEQEMLTTAFVVTYARLFTKGNGILFFSVMISLPICETFMMNFIKSEMSDTRTTAGMNLLIPLWGSHSLAHSFISRCR